MTATVDDALTGATPDPVAALLQAFTGFYELGLDPRTHADLGRRSGCGVSWVELDLLRHVRASGPTTVAGLARSSGRREPAVLRSLQVLQVRGFVVRRHDTHDRRALRVHLTPQGEMADDRRLGALREVAQEIMADWSSEDVETLSALFSRYADRAMARVGDGPPAGGVSGR